MKQKHVVLELWRGRKEDSKSTFNLMYSMFYIYFNLNICSPRTMTPGKWLIISISILVDLYPLCSGEFCNGKYLLHCNPSILPRPLDWEGRETVSWKVAGWLPLLGTEYFLDKWLGGGIVWGLSVWKACGFFPPGVQHCKTSMQGLEV